MAIQALKKQSDLEKRLQLLRKQVYGKNQYKTEDRRPTTESHTVSDIAYLYRDLLKILLFSSLAIGTQVLLFFLMKYRYLNINF